MMENQSHAGTLGSQRRAVGFVGTDLAVEAAARWEGTTAKGRAHGVERGLMDFGDGGEVAGVAAEVSSVPDLPSPLQQWVRSGALAKALRTRARRRRRGSPVPRRRAASPSAWFIVFSSSRFRKRDRVVESGTLRSRNPPRNSPCSRSRTAVSRKVPSGYHIQQRRASNCGGGNGCWLKGVRYRSRIAGATSSATRANGRRPTSALVPPAFAANPIAIARSIKIVAAPLFGAKDVNRANFRLAHFRLWTCW